ncbi:MAG: septum formation initiator family protein [Candidatus Buchananbacteria bacterium]
MVYTKRSSSLGEFFSSKLLLAVLFLLVLLVLVGVVKETYRRYVINQEIKAIKSEVARLEQKNLEVSQLIDYLKTGDYAEREARLKLGLQKPGETVAIVTGAQKSQANENNVEVVISNPQKWYNYFFK